VKASIFGVFRLFLAAVAVTFHAGLHPLGLYSGVSAVVVFYILSGYVITGMITTRFPGTKSFGAFMAERTIRIAPQYYFWIAVSFVFVLLLHWTPIAPGKPSAWIVFSFWRLIPLALQR
jgi:peptidoglycan/LPS O-acetylase OafA/YrhL